MPPQSPTPLVCCQWGKKPPGPGQKIYVSDFPLRSWELSYTMTRKVITVGTPSAPVARADGSHLIWDDVPASFFAYQKREASPETDFESVANHRNSYSDHLELPQSNVSARADLEYPIPTAGYLSRRAALTGTSFLDPKVNLDVLSCALDSDISGCDDCDNQDVPAIPPIGAGTDVPSAPTGPAPTSGGTKGCVAIVYYQDDHKKLQEYHAYEFYPLTPSIDVCPEINPPDWIESGAPDAMPSEMTGISAFGDKWSGSLSSRR